MRVLHDLGVGSSPVFRHRSLIIGEVVYLPFDPAVASLFFQLIVSQHQTIGRPP